MNWASGQGTGAGMDGQQRLGGISAPFVYAAQDREGEASKPKQGSASVGFHAGPWNTGEHGAPASQPAASSQHPHLGIQHMPMHQHHLQQTYPLNSMPLYVDRADYQRHAQRTSQVQVAFNPGLQGSFLSRGAVLQDISGVGQAGFNRGLMHSQNKTPDSDYLEKNASNIQGYLARNPGSFHEGALNSNLGGNPNLGGPLSLHNNAVNVAQLVLLQQQQQQQPGRSVGSQHAGVGSQHFAGAVDASSVSQSHALARARWGISGRDVDEYRLRAEGVGSSLVDCDGTLVPQQGKLAKASYSSASEGLTVVGLLAFNCNCLKVSQ